MTSVTLKLFGPFVFVAILVLGASLLIAGGIPEITLPLSNPEVYDEQQQVTETEVEEEEPVVETTDEFFNEEYSPSRYMRTVTSTEPLILEGDEVLEIRDTRYIQKNDIILKDRAQLIIINSLVEHKHNYSFQHRLEATDHAQIIVRNSEIRSSPWLNWNFYDRASLSFENVEQKNSGVWHGFQNNAEATIRGSKFRATMSENVQFDIANASEVFVELVFPINSFIDETLPTRPSDYEFPGSNEDGIAFNLKMRNVSTSAWGITVPPKTDATIRGAKNLVVTFNIGYPWSDVTAEFDNLRATHYADKEWKVRDMRLRLINVVTERWSPIVGEDNILIIRDSDLADNAFSYDNARVFIHNSTMSFVRAKDHVEITLNRTTVDGDVVATDNGKIILIDSIVKGQIIKEGDGRIIKG